MLSMGVGVDIVSMARIRGIVNRRGAARFAKRIFCNAEIDAFQSSMNETSRDVEFLAGRYGWFLIMLTHQAGVQRGCVQGFDIYVPTRTVKIYLCYEAFRY